MSPVTFFTTYAVKATTAAAAAAVTRLTLAISDGHVDGGEWVQTGVLALISFLAVFAAPSNTPKPLAIVKDTVKS